MHTFRRIIIHYALPDYKLLIGDYNADKLIENVSNDNTIAQEA